MNILLTNDDGYDAPGLRAAYEAIKDLGRVIVVAPSSEQSACSHRITLRGPIKARRIAHRPFGETVMVDGTPADCVRLAICEILEEPASLVISGVNAGANAGVDTFYSGTVAGAREGAILGVRSIALSQAHRELETNWTQTAAALRQIVPMLLKESLPAPGFWNVNLPAPLPDDVMSSIHRVRVCPRSVPLAFEREEHDDGRSLEFNYPEWAYWKREADEATDFGVIRGGGIAISRIPLTATFDGE